MKEWTPTIRRISWVAVIPQIITLSVLVFMGDMLMPRYGISIGAGIYIGYVLAARRYFTRYHRAGIRLVKLQKFNEAVVKFKQGLDYFNKYPWIDRFRSIVVMSPSAMTYREIQLVNIAFCYSQMGDGQSARSYYEQCLQQYPANGIAISALRMMDAGQNKSDA